MLRLKSLASIIIAVLFLIGCGPESVDQQTQILKDDSETIKDDFLTAEDIIGRFMVFDLPVGKIIIYDEETCPNNLLGRPGQYVGKADWEDTRVEQYSDTLTGGTIEIFKDADSLKKRKEYLEPFLEEAMFLQYMFIHKNVIIRVDKELTSSDQVLNLV